MNHDNNRKLIYIILILIVVLGVTGYSVYQKSLILATYTSPSGKYEAIIKRNRGFFTPTMPGDGGPDSLPVVVILKESSGNTIGSSKDNTECGIFYGSIDIEWDFKNQFLWYGIARTIHLKTGEVGC